MYSVSAMAITLGLALRVEHAPAALLQPEQALRNAAPVLNVMPIVDSATSPRAYTRDFANVKDEPLHQGDSFLTYSQHGEGLPDTITGQNINIFV